MYLASVVADEQSAKNLSKVILNPRRIRPIVVTTVAVGETASRIDAEQIASQAGDLVDVYVITTMDASWEFARHMPEGVAVYGGAGRIYPTGSSYLVDKFLSPLHVALDASHGARITEKLISEALAMSFEAGHASSSTVERKKAEGTVKGFAAGRAMVELHGRGYAFIAPELTLANFAAEELFEVGQNVSGLLNSETNRLDVSESLKTQLQALAEYQIGDVILAKVKEVSEDLVTLLLYPRVIEKEICVSVPKDMVTGNPLDDLRDLMSSGDVVRSRVIGTSPNWALVLMEIDDDEYVLPPPSVLPNGPAWIKEVDPYSPEESDQNQDASNLIEDIESQEEIFEQIPKHGRKLTEQLLLTIENKNAQTSSLKEQVVTLGSHLEQAEQDRQLLRWELRELKREFNLLESTLTKLRAKLRKSKTSKDQSSELPIFADPEEGFRFLVLTQWAIRFPGSQQKDLPLKEFTLGPKFLDSLENLQGISREKVTDVVVEIATGIASELAGREVHRLREGAAGDARHVTREDGAVCWRASLQVGTSSARRIHYWVLPGGSIEFSRVTIHDDFLP
ncbi:unannotated protein [freshwater metagenome]|uniref:Unannotated protein n=1 Tax=freshwater metagenome TaxID=449393 RepID=A0A6J6Q091_9ZZZZ|nr:hypothetical protein [Actinomycetota bacterium]MSW25415.1 hypothetical protein [Actinomycetota bacterium]MSX97775.1 hypothetical protein [Actinomycetota bacterium]MSZ78931.1 hypothetical protein [Actinomycetota bacterium]